MALSSGSWKLFPGDGLGAAHIQEPIDTHMSDNEVAEACAHPLPEDDDDDLIGYSDGDELAPPLPGSSAAVAVNEFGVVQSGGKAAAEPQAATVEEQWIRDGKPRCGVCMSKHPPPCNPELAEKIIAARRARKVDKKAKKAKARADVQAEADAKDKADAEAAAKADAKVTAGSQAPADPKATGSSRKRKATAEPSSLAASMHVPAAKRQKTMAEKIASLQDDYRNGILALLEEANGPEELQAVQAILRKTKR